MRLAISIRINCICHFVIFQRIPQQTNIASTTLSYSVPIKAQSRLQRLPVVPLYYEPPVQVYPAKGLLPEFRLNPYNDVGTSHQINKRFIIQRFNQMNTGLFPNTSSTTALTFGFLCTGNKT